MKHSAAINLDGVWAIYRYELRRTQRTIWQSVATPVITTALYFVVFGAAIGSRISEVGGVSYGAFIVPGLIMLSLLTQSISNASIGIYFPKFTGTIFELLSAPLSSFEAVSAYVGAAATKSVGIGLVILATATLFVPVRIEHPVWMVAFLILTSVAFSLFGFIIGIWAKNFEQLAIIPALMITPLTFLGGAFYSIDMLPPFWRVRQPVQPRGLSRQRLPLELLRQGRRQRRRQPRLHDAVHRRVPRGIGLHIPHRMAAETVRGGGIDRPKARLQYRIIVLLRVGVCGALRPHHRHRRLAGHRRGDLPPPRRRRLRDRGQLRRRRQSRRGDRRRNREVGRAGEGIPGRRRRPGRASRLFEQSDEGAGTARGLVNNAGVAGRFARVDEQDAAELTRLFATNVIATILACKEAVKPAFDPPRRKRRRDRQHVVDRGADRRPAGPGPTRRPRARLRASRRASRPRSAPRESGSTPSRRDGSRPT